MPQSSIDTDRRASLPICNESLRLSERDSLRVLDLLGSPPPPNDKLLAAASALPVSR